MKNILIFTTIFIVLLAIPASAANYDDRHFGPIKIPMEVLIEKLK